MRAFVFAFAMGALFGSGLMIAGMTEPANIKGFLDLAGDWRPGAGCARWPQHGCAGVCAGNGSRDVDRAKAWVSAPHFELPHTSVRRLHQRF